MFSVAVMLFSLSSQAYVIGDDGANACKGNGDAVLCAISVSFYLPTLLIADSEVKLNPELAAVHVLSEIDKDEKPVTEEIAKKNGISVEEVQEVFIENYGM